MTWRQKVTAEDLKAGVARILWGLFKKLVVADTVSMQVDAVYADPRRSRARPWSWRRSCSASRSIATFRPIAI
ncbi:hypothetical protein ACFQ4K_19325 [Tistrella bauzanensis]